MKVGETVISDEKKARRLAEDSGHALAQASVISNDLSRLLKVGCQAMN